MDPRDVSQTQQVCSLLMRYPDDVLCGLIDSIADIVADLPAPARDELREFVAYLRRTPLLEVQRHYVETFDMRRKCSPYLTYWTFGDTRNRGMALLHFKAAYREVGLTIDESELPDHLAVVLEFAAIGDAELGHALLAEHRGALSLLSQALRDAGSPYAHVLAAVLATTGELTADDVALMSRLATEGPPGELVGMAGPVDLTLAPFAAGDDVAMGARR